MMLLLTPTFHEVSLFPDLAIMKTRGPIVKSSGGQKGTNYVSLIPITLHLPFQSVRRWHADTSDNQAYPPPMNCFLSYT